MELLDLDSFRRAPFCTDPFDYLVVPDFIRPTALPELLQDFPAIDKPGLLPVSAAPGGPAFRRLLFHHARRHFAQNLPRGEFSIAQRGVQVLHLAVTVLARDSFQIGLGYLAELHAQAARLLVQVLLADVDGLHALAGVDDVLDFVAGARRFDERQPVFTRLVTRLGHNLHDVAVAQRIA